MNEITYVRWVHHDLPEADRMARVNDGVHHDYHSELVECDAAGNPLSSARPVGFQIGGVLPDLPALADEGAGSLS